MDNKIIGKVKYLVANNFLYIGKLFGKLSIKSYNIGINLHIKFDTKYKQKILLLKKQLNSINKESTTKTDLEKDPLIVSNKHGNA